MNVKTHCKPLIGLIAFLALAQAHDIGQHHVHNEGGGAGIGAVAGHLQRAITKIVDLSYPLDEKTLHWPIAPPFKYESLKDGQAQAKTPNSTYYVKSDAFQTGVHTGTHLDAPRHFGEKSWTVNEIPLERLVDVPVTVIDLSAKVAANRTYSFQVDDFRNAQTNASLVKPQSVVLVYTGVSESYAGGQKAYFGTDSKDYLSMQIPGFGKQAAEYLVSQNVFGVGLDAPSADSSSRHGANDTIDPEAHVVFNTNNVYILENVSGNLKQLVANDGPGTRLHILPLAIIGGSGSPVRIAATIGTTTCTTPVVTNRSMLSSVPNSSLLIALSLIALSIFASNRIVQNRS